MAAILVFMQKVDGKRQLTIHRVSGEPNRVRAATHGTYGLYVLSCNRVEVMKRLVLLSGNLARMPAVPKRLNACRRKERLQDECWLLELWHYRLGDATTLKLLEEEEYDGQGTPARNATC